MNHRQSDLQNFVNDGISPYSDYKASGVEWLGEIPDHWETKRIKHLLIGRKGAIKTGPFGSQLHSSEMMDSEIKVFNQRTVLDRDINSGRNYISSTKFNQLRAFETFPGDMLVTTRGTIGRCMIVPVGAPRGILHPCLLRIQIEKRIAYDHYVEYLIQDSGLILTQLEYMSNATTIEVIYSDSFKEAFLPLPPLPEQRAIAAILDRETARIDALVTKKERLIELLQEKRAALISHMVTRGLDSNVPTKDSGVEWLGEVPAHWEVKRLKYTAPLRGTRLESKSKGDVYIGLENIESWTGRLIMEYKTETVEPAANLFQAGDVLFGKLRPYLAKVVRPDICGVSSSEIIALSPVEYSQSYLFYCLLNKPYIQYVNMLTYGTKMPRVSPEQVGDSLLPFPTLIEQRKIAAFLDRETGKIDTLIAKVRDAIAHMKELRQGLISAAVTGKIDVRKVG